MRRCEHCGLKYSDKVFICPVDGQPTINPHARSGQISGAGSGGASFRVTIVSPMSSAGTYQIFVQGGDLIFIQVESNSRHVLNNLVPLPGPFGGFVVLFGWLFSRNKVDDFNERLKSATPETLLRDSNKNFLLHLAEIRQSVIEPAVASSFGNKEVGRAVLTIRQGEKLTLAFAAREDMEAVWKRLASGSFAPLQAEVEWDAGSQQYLKKHPPKTNEAKTI